ncbi:MAG: hypothetical protein JWO72_322 [Caulobacteraceae bacterium]|nr:hypothetical protein [Caulobacteraceae bacterium]
MSDRSYRLYNLSDQGGIVGAVNRSFADDSEALSHARELLERVPAIEIWQTDRLVGRVVRSSHS